MKIWRELFARGPRHPTWTFLRGLAAAYFCAFVSFAVQARGLIGEHGILPADEWLKVIQARAGFFDVPTLLWWGASDFRLLLVSIGGAVVALLVVAGVWPRALLFLEWVLYLSIVNVGQTFMHYQWDALLLEAGLCGVLFSPSGFFPRSDAAPSVSGVFVVRWLLFRLMFLSGLVKLASGDATWRSLRALDFHYYTQPLPVWTSYFMQQLPSAFGRVSCALMFCVELGLPFLFFLPWRFRRVALFGTVGLQLLILATGSYGFFNLLTLVLCVGLCEFPARLGPMVPWRRFLRWGFVSIVVVVSLNEAAERFVEETPLSRATTVLAPFQSINSYGLFAVMTTERNEITLQGSNDGHNWSTYEFLYKPGALDRWPRFTGAHMPRLDWQMWFAALGQCGHNRWLLAMLRKLLVDPATIIGLLRENPFGEKPPRYLRTTIRPYFFTALGEPNVWREEKSQPYCPAVMLEGDDLVEAKPSDE